jgi:hypothetical protein
MDRHGAPPVIKRYATRLARELGGTRPVLLLMVAFVLFALYEFVRP